MARPTKRLEEIDNMYLRQKFLKQGYKDLKEAADSTGIPYSTLVSWCKNKSLSQFFYIKYLADVFDEDVPDWIELITTSGA